jgi:predicted NBD/HSP70 family sugar kinase
MRKINLTSFQVATSETARQINRRIALNLIRRHQPLSRAELARQSGLQRSTVSAIIAQLIGEGWVTEGASPVSTRGRRPRFLHLNVERAGIFAVDLRPVNTRVGLAGLDARFLMQTSWQTPSSPEAFAAELARTVDAFRAAHPEMVCEGMGVSLPGRIDESGQIVFAPNLGWVGVNIRELIEAAVKLPVAVENAASACALAELWFGRHPDDVTNLVAVTISEGIGVGLLLNGQLVHGYRELAGEFGHMTLDEQGPLCRCGNRGCWEQFASNKAALRYYDELRGGTDSSTPLKIADLVRLSGERDANAIKAIERMAHFLGIGLATLAIGLAPQVMVVVGDVTLAWDRIGPIVADVVARHSPRTVHVNIVPTDPGSQPRLRGAVTLVVQQHFGAPRVA